jgi:hypothetical protein
MTTSGSRLLHIRSRKRAKERKRSNGVEVSYLQVIKNMERETRIELATNSLEGCDSTIELLPPTWNGSSSIVQVPRVPGSIHRTKALRARSSVVLNFASRSYVIKLLRFP